MYCSKCGVQNSDGSTHCVNCGSVLSDIPQQPPVQPDIAEAVTPKTSGLAIAAFVMGLLSLTCVLWPFLVIPAVICAILALMKIGKSDGQLKGNGFAIAGIVIPVVMMVVIIPLLLAVLMPALSRAKMVAQRVVCATNLKSVSTAMIVYMNDYDEKYPTSEQWSDLLIEKADVSPDSFCCPMDTEGSFSYAINENVYHHSQEHISPQMVVLFEADLGRNGVGGPEDLQVKHVDGCNVAFADGHIEFVKIEQLPNLQWTVE